MLIEAIEIDMMGGCFSSKTSKTKPVTLKTIRVVHLDGSLQDFENPATVDQVISNFPKHFVCSPMEIFQSGLVPLNLDHQLKTGQLYFILPNSTLKFNASPDDLTSLTRKLTTIAKTKTKTKTTQCRAKPSSVPTATPAASPPESRSLSKFLDGQCGDNREVLLSSPKSPLWKPTLDPITEG